MHQSLPRAFQLLHDFIMCYTYVFHGSEEDSDKVHARNAKIRSFWEVGGVPV